MIIHWHKKYLWDKSEKKNTLLATFMVPFIFNIFSLLHCCRINPLKEKAHNHSESIGCVYEIQDLLLFIMLSHTHKDTQRHQLLLEQSIRRLWLWQCSILFTGRLLHLTFIVAPGGCGLHANAIEAFNAKGPGPPVSASSKVYSC